MKTKILICFFLFLSSFSFAQEYYVFVGKSEILNKQSLEQKLKDFNQKVKEQTDPNKTHIAVAGYRIVDTYKKGDSIINKVQYSFEFKATRNEKIYSFENKLLPEFSLRNLRSKKITSDDLKGEVTFINLWFTNCFPCVKEIPLLK